MPHLIIIYYFLTIILGSIVSGLFLVYGLKKKNYRYLIFMVFYSMFTLWLTIMLVNSYFKTNLNNYFINNIDLFMLVHFSIESVFLLSMLVFWNNLLKIPYRRLINSIGGVLIGLSYLTHVFSIVRGHLMLFYSGQERLSLFQVLAKDLPSIMIIGYSLILLIVRKKHFLQPQEQRLIRNIIFLVMIFLPGIVFDVVFNDFSSVVFVPLFFLGFGLLFTLDLIRSIGENKSADSPEEALLTLFRKSDLSAREIEVGLLIAKGQSNKDIAEELYISVSTVKAHSFRIFKKMSISSRHELIALKYRGHQPD